MTDYELSDVNKYHENIDSHLAPNKVCTETSSHEKKDSPCTPSSPFLNLEKKDNSDKMNQLGSHSTPLQQKQSTPSCPPPLKYSKLQNNMIKKDDTMIQSSNLTNNLKLKLSQVAISNINNSNNNNNNQIQSQEATPSNFLTPYNRKSDTNTGFLNESTTLLLYYNYYHSYNFDSIIVVVIYFY